MVELTYEERLNIFQIDPRQASLEDISNMAMELSARLYKRSIMVEEIVEILTKLKSSFKDGYIAGCDKPTYNDYVKLDVVKKVLEEKLH